MPSSQDGSRVVVAKVGAIVKDEPLALRLFEVEFGLGVREQSFFYPVFEAPRCAPRSRI